MKPVFSIIVAAAAVLGTLVRNALGDDSESQGNVDSASPIPPMTPRLVESYVHAGASDADIADRFLVDVELIRREFADVLRSARAVRRIGIRGWQTELAKKINGPILIWLGRNELGQSLNPAMAGMPMPEMYEGSNESMS